MVEASDHRRVRCAIYTRTSTVDGLAQEFNSLDAQREACEAYVTSQRGEGWVLVPSHYVDGGFSGGSMDRPALARLFDDLRDGLIDMIVVYKIDRLTRSLTDFVKMIEMLDAAGASFVSISQSFNTRTSMGRLTLNVLLSFAQFERELSGERIRDKIAASKAKGLWTGGSIPLGYDVVDRELVVNDDEARIVRTIMRLYLKTKSVSGLVAILQQKGILTKLHADGRGGQPFQKTALYTLLKNQTYRGLTKHHDRTYAGRHAAIVGPALWQRVQAQLEHNARSRRTGATFSEPSLLAGMIVADDGSRMSTTHTRKGERRYHYYATTAAWTKSRRADFKVVRVSAPVVDKEVRRLLTDYLSDRGARASEWLARDELLEDVRAWTGVYRTLGQQAASAARRDLRVLLMSLGATVTLGKSSIRLSLCGNALEKCRTGRIVTTRAPVLLSAEREFSWTGTPTNLVVSPGIRGKVAETRRLILLLTKAFDAHDEIFERGQQAKPQPSASRLARVCFLAPDIIGRIFSGQCPKELTARRLYSLPFLPLDWRAQRELLGFDPDPGRSDTLGQL